MAELPFLPLATDAYLADTTHLTTEQHGAYLLLLMAAWRNPDCDLPDDEVQLAQICRMSLRSWRAKNAPVLAFFSLKSGRLKQKRLSETREKVKVKRKQRLDALDRAMKARKRKPDGQPGDEPDGRPSGQPDGAPNQNQNQKGTETRSGTTQANSGGVTAPAYTPSMAIADFNRAALELGLSQARNLSASRRTSITRRLSEIGGRDGWLSVLDHLRQAPFLIGENESGWKATLDWIVKPANLTKIVEGTYANRGGGQSKTERLRRERRESTERVKDYIRRKEGES